MNAGPTLEEIGVVLDPTAFGSHTPSAGRKAALNRAKKVQALYAEFGGWTEIKEASREADALLLATFAWAEIGHWDSEQEAWIAGPRDDPEYLAPPLVPTHFRLIGRLPPMKETRYA